MDQNTMVFPAYAGVNLLSNCRSAMGARIPRVCGGEPKLFSPLIHIIPYSPRMRG